jgi:HlyD family secretion protein
VDTSRLTKLFILVVVGTLLVGTAGVLAWHLFTPESGLVQVSGRIESDKVTLASKVAGRVATISVREGDAVHSGQVMALLEDRTARAQLAEARAAAEVAANQVGAERSALAVLRREVPAAIATAEAGVSAAHANLRQRQSVVLQARLDADRAQGLARDHLIDAQSAERSELAWKEAQEQLSAAAADDRKAEEGLRDAQIGPVRIQAKEAELAAFASAEKQARAHAEEVGTLVEELTLVAPMGGTVTGRFVNVGEVVNVGTPAYELVDLDHLYLQVYVPEAQIGKVRIGLPAQLYTDAFPDRAFPATVRYIASRAEFTPKEVQTPDERVKLVYEVRLYLDQNPQHRLTPGLPCDAVIRWRDGEPWRKPRW